jgi:translation initiation factor 1
LQGREQSATPERNEQRDARTPTANSQKRKAVAHGPDYLPATGAPQFATMPPMKKTQSLADLGGLVYSTEAGRMCPTCRLPVAQCTCKQDAAAAAVGAGDGIVRVQRETKGRGGKAVTLVRGVALGADALAVLGKQIKAACGSGGTVKEGVIEVQGDHVERVMALLQAKGYKVKRAGG